MAEQTRYVQYDGQKDFNKDRRKWERERWYVANASEVKQPVGVRRLATIGIGALVVAALSSRFPDVDVAAVASASSIALILSYSGFVPLPGKYDTSATQSMCSSASD